MAFDIYAEEMLRNYEKPHNKGKMESPSSHIHEENITCGDEITVDLEIKEGKITDIKFDGHGCVISIASASLVTDFIKGKSLREIEKMNKGTVIDVIGIDPGYARIHCATLSMRAIKKAVFAFENKQEDKSTKEL